MHTGFSRQLGNPECHHGNVGGSYNPNESNKNKYLLNGLDFCFLIIRLQDD